MKDRSSADLERYLKEHAVAGEVVHLPVDTLSVEAAARAVGVDVDQIVKSLLFNVAGRPVLVLGHGTAPVDRGRLAAYFGVSKRRVRLATRPEVAARTGYPAGAVPPLGHDGDLPIIASARLRDHDLLYAGGGDADALLRISSAALLESIDAEELDVMQIDPEQDG